MDIEIQSEYPWIPKIPPELWKLIFISVKDAYKQEHCANWNNAIAELRKVCPKWRYVIDNHIEFEIELTTKFLSRNFPIQHVRFYKCSVSNLVIMPIQPSEIPFSNPHLVKEVIFGEFVSKANFLVFAEYFGTRGKVERVQIKEGFRFCDKVETTQEEREDEILGRFLKNVENLEVVVLPVEFMVEGLRRDRNMIRVLSNANLPKLKDLKIWTHSNFMTTRLFFSFLLRHRSTIENLDVNTTPFDDLGACSLFLEDKKIDSELYKNPVAEIRVEDLETIKLKRITIKGGSLSHVVRKAWMPIIMAQKGLLQLKLDHCGGSAKVDEFGFGPLPFDNFIPLIECNKSTLTSLELGMFHFSENVDFKIFEQLSKLQVLNLQKQDDDGKLSRIVNMTRLPSSLRILSLSGFACVNI